MSHNSMSKCTLSSNLVGHGGGDMFNWEYIYKVVVKS